MASLACGVYLHVFVSVATSNDRPDIKLIFLNEGKGQFQQAGSWGAPEWSTRNASAADLNGDGRPDLIAANRPGPSYVCLNDGKARFATQPCIPIPAKSATSIANGDFNKDGTIDLAVPARDGGQSLVHLNDGRANFTRTIPFGPPDVTARIGAAADFNADGWLDIVTTDERVKQVDIAMARSEARNMVYFAVRRSCNEQRPSDNGGPSGSVVGNCWLFVPVTIDRGEDFTRPAP